MNQKSVIFTLSGLLAVFSVCILITNNQQASDTFGKLAFGALTAMAAYLQHKD